MDTNPKGRTIWEMLTQRNPPPAPPAPPVSFANPLDLRIGESVAVSDVNGPELRDYDFSVKEVRQYTRRINNQEFNFTDYVLKGINSKTFEARDEITARQRVVPNSQGTNTWLFLRLYDEFAFAEDFLAVVKDDTGVFEVTDDDTGAKETYTRINDLRDPYQADVLIVTATTDEGKVTTGTTKPGRIEYWDYWRDVDLGNGNTAKQFIFVEIDSSTGWTQIWRGREFFE